MNQTNPLSTLTRLPVQLQSLLQPRLSNWLAPPRLGRYSQLLPEPVRRRLIEVTLNHILREPIEEGDFDYLAGRWLQVAVKDAQLFITIGFEQGRLVCREVGSRAAACDAQLSLLTADAIALIRQQVDPDTLFFQRKLSIGGDTELAHHVKNTLDTLQPDAIPALLLSILHKYQAIISSPAS